MTETMRKLSIYMIGLTFLSCLFSCTMIEELEDNQGVPPCEEKIAMTFSAVIDDGTETKTVLDGELGEDRRKVLWLPSDTIGVVTAGKANPIEKFFNTVTETSAIGTFEGDVAHSTSYHAIYPYGRTFVAYSSEDGGASCFRFDFPRVQKYVPGTFATDSAPMVGRTAEDGTLKFKNLCGLLALKLKGEETIKSITFTGKDSEGEPLYVSGPFIVDMDYEEAPEVVPAALVADGITTYKDITLVCDEPVALSPDQATPFYIMLPPGIYDSFELLITTSDGKLMLKTGKSLTINRAHVRPAAALEYAETISVDLSENGTSNCYIVPSSGIYSFDASVIGNGEFGFINTELYHEAQSEKIDPVSAEILWVDREGVIQGVSYSGGKISFLASGIEGNALIVARDADDNIVWSWHIWATDVPVDQTYVNSAGTFEVQDRNLGATRADRGTGDEWKESCGLQYNWGRKDPLLGGHFTTSSSNDKSITISSPDLKISWGSSPSPSAWKDDSKTVYDPCPVGYRVAPNAIWKDFTFPNSNFDHGWYFKYNDAGDAAWYPVSSRGDQWGTSYLTEGYMWSSSLIEGWKLKPFRFASYVIDRASDYSTADPNQVRCVNDNETVSLILEWVDLLLEGSADVKLSARVNLAGTGNIEKGFVYSESMDVNLDNGTKVSCGPEEGVYNALMSDLKPGTRYFVRPYVIFGDQTYYASERYFTTPYVEHVDLSAGGTSNCYIIHAAGTYRFNCSVKGNGTESVGEPDRVEVLWETFNTTDAVSIGSVISSVELDGNYVEFSTPEIFTPGNALIAVKNMTGKIIWSWHIWAADFDPYGFADIYSSGAMMMDRNLGALNNKEGDARSFGMYYQWGRKDPFVRFGNTANNTFAATAPADIISYVENDSSTDLLEYATRYPYRIIKSSKWNSKDTYWSDVKTQYDPCPPGWRVPDRDVWNGFNTSEAYYPSTKAVYNGSFTSSGVFNWINEINYFYKGSNNVGSYSVYYEMPVRCMKDAVFTVSNLSEADVIKDRSVTVSGTLTVSDDTRIEVKGFICSTSSDPKLYTTGAVITDEGTSHGDFTSTITGLKPGTQYYIRAYAKGGYNVRYGDVITLKTKEGASGEGYVEDEDIFEW